MSNEVKKVLKKLRKGPVIEIDSQILRWRKELKRQGIVLGRKTERQKRINAQAKANNEKPVPTKRKWF